MSSLAFKVSSGFDVPMGPDKRDLEARIGLLDLADQLDVALETDGGSE